MHQPPKPELTPEQCAYLARLVVAPQDIWNIKRELAGSFWYS